MGSSPSIAQNKKNQQIANYNTLKKQEEVKLNEENDFNMHNKRSLLANNNTTKKRSILLSHKDAESEQNQDEVSIKHRLNNKQNRGSFSDLDDSDHSKQDVFSRTEIKLQNNNGSIFSNQKKHGGFTQQSSFQQNHSFNQHYKESSQKSAFPMQQEKRLFGDFYVSPVKEVEDSRSPTYLTHFNNDELSTTAPKEEMQKKRKQNGYVISEEKKLPEGKLFESRNIVEIKDRNQNFFTKGNVVLSVNHYSNFKAQRSENQEKFQSELLKQVVELGIQPTEYILDNAIKQEYEDKKNIISDLEIQGSKNQKSSNRQKVQIIIYPGFHEVFQNKTTQKKTIHSN